MVETFPIYLTKQHVAHQQRRAFWSWLVWFVGVMGITAVLGLLMYRGGADPSFLGWLIFIIGIAAIIYQPRYGVYLIIFFTLVGDSHLLYWYPFNKNFSSGESLFYLNDLFIFSPVEFCLALTLLVWLGRGIMERRLKFYATELFWPAIIFIGFILLGLAYGITRGGSLVIGLWESRPIFYLPLMLVLTSNLLNKREHISHLMWVIMLALFIEGLVGTWFYIFVLKGDLGLVEAITEHSAAIHLNTVFIFTITVWMYKGSASKRLLLLPMVPPVLLTFLATQRRAAFITVIVAIVLIFIVLYKENRLAFWLIVPPIALIGLVYVAAFWNRSGGLAMPAQAIKSVIAEDQADERDQRSNLYRDMENVNSLFTIRNATLFGVGFGNKFYIIVAMADISFFVWWEYITHNSIIWIWMKSGVGGFVSMIFLVGLSIMVGVRALLRMPKGDLSAVALTGTLYLVMHFIYAYVDMSWDTQSMIYVGTMMGLLSVMEHIVAQPVALPPNRWPWQPAPQPVPGLKPLTGE